NLWIPELQHPGNTTHYICPSRARRLPFRVRAAPFTIPYTLVLDSGVRCAGVAAGSVRQLRRKRNAFRRIKTFLLRSCVRCPTRSSKKEAGACTLAASRRHNSGSTRRSDLRRVIDADRVQQIFSLAGRGGYRLLQLAGGAKAEPSAVLVRIDPNVVDQHLLRK